MSRIGRPSIVVTMLVLIVLGAVSAAALTGNLSTLQYRNIPLLHPYPPAGQYVNPFTGDPRDLIDAAEAARVRADLMRDGEMQLEALADGDAGKLARTATGRFLTALEEAIASNGASGVVYREEHRFESVVIGRLPAPGESSASWCAEERGRGKASYVSQPDGRVVFSSGFRFVSRFWLVRIDDRYVIADAVISSAREPMP